MGMGCGGKCGMFFLIAINTLFLLLGLGLLIIGIIMRVDSDFLDKTEVISVLNSVEFNGNLSLGNVASHLSILVISIGAFILVIAAMGAFGACCKNRCLLVVYAIIVLLVFIVQCVAVGLWFTMKSKVENEVKGKLNTVFDKYAGPAATDETSIGWNLIFIGFECCGVDDISSTSNDQEFSTTAWWANRNSNNIPYSCCSSATEDNYKTGTETACTQTWTGYRDSGCYNAFKAWLDKYQTPAIVVGVLLLVIEILAVVFAFVICREVGKKDFAV